MDGSERAVNVLQRACAKFASWGPAQSAEQIKVGATTRKGQDNIQVAPEVLLTAPMTRTRFVGVAPCRTNAVSSYPCLGDRVYIPGLADGGLAFRHCHRPAKDRSAVAGASDAMSGT